MSGHAFGPIATQGMFAQHHTASGPSISGTVQQDMVGHGISRVDRLRNVIACAYLIIALQVPLCVRHRGVRKTVRTFALLHVIYMMLKEQRKAILGGVLLVMLAWVRYAAGLGIVHTLSSNASYALVILRQVRLPYPSLSFHA